MYAAYLDDELVGMCAILPQPGVAGIKYPAWRVHRLVVLPDYQGLGIAIKLLEYICDLYAYHERIVYIRTSHTKLINYMMRSDKWQGDGNMQTSHHQTGILSHIKIKDESRLSTSFKYVAPCQYVEGRSYNKLSFNERSVNPGIQPVSLW